VKWTKSTSERFTIPSLSTLTDLTRYCFHIVDDKAPDELRRMKECLQTPFVLAAIGELLNQLEIIYPPEPTKGRIVNKDQLKKSLVDYVIPELSKYAGKTQSLKSDIDASDPAPHLNIQTWQAAVETLVNAVKPILSQVFLLESLEQVDATNQSYMVRIRTYRDGTVSASEKRISFEELEEYDSDTSSLIMTRKGSPLHIYLFPFLVIKDDQLFFYKRTRASGYEYYSISENRAFIAQTKRKFSHSAFRIGSKGAQQALFWTEVLPIENEKSGIKANIPSEGPVEFVGRKTQIKTIKKEIIEIPNQNGIIYGVGGVGKTALMIQLSRELFEEEDRESILFDNIIWVSAKSNFYNPTLDIVEVRKKQFESLDNIISTILDFFDFEDLEGYAFEDKKALLLEVLNENRVLLVLDNF
jgi:hypothetical protein